MGAEARRGDCVKIGERRRRIKNQRKRIKKNDKIDEPDYLPLDEIYEHMPKMYRDWGLALNQFAISFPGRVPGSEGLHS
jgi:hypothetical protein